MIDDGSPFLPEEEGVSVVSDLAGVPPKSEVTIFHFPAHLGRKTIRNFPGWFRSFTFSVKIAEALGVDKIVHIESDAFILSRRARFYVDKAENGWIAFWCPMWRFPESAFQIICRDEFDALDRVGSTDYDKNYAHKLMEESLPFTKIEKNIYGDRFGEFRSTVPRRADFAVQVDEDIAIHSVFD